MAKGKNGNLSFLLDVEASYFNWLCELVKINQEDDSYFILAQKLHAKMFVGVIPNDSNRGEDGKDLRAEFAAETSDISLEQTGIEQALSGPCSVFEMLIALAKRIEYILYEDDRPDMTAKWFWIMLENLGLSNFSDGTYFDRGGTEHVYHVIDEFLMRNYDRKGRGGLFPLKRPKEDQRNVEIWYQMNAYLEENYAAS